MSGCAQQRINEHTFALLVSVNDLVSGCNYCTTVTLYCIIYGSRECLRNGNEGLPLNECSTSLQSSGLGIFNIPVFKLFIFRLERLDVLYLSHDLLSASFRNRMLIYCYSFKSNWDISQIILLINILCCNILQHYYWSKTQFVYVYRMSWTLSVVLLFTKFII